MAVKAVFFDLDGTLLDTSHDLANALNCVLRHHNLAELPYERIRSEVSNGATALIKLGFGSDLNEQEVSALRTQLLEYYLANIATHTCLFPGIEPLLNELNSHKIAWGIVTNKPHQYTSALIDQLTFAYAPAAVVSPEHVGISKPDPAPLLHACELAACKPSEAVYVGDHLRDIECGYNAGMRTIAVGYGFVPEPGDHLNWKATHCVDHADEIWPIIRRYSLNSQ